MIGPWRLIIKISNGARWGFQAATSSVRPGCPTLRVVAILAAVVWQVVVWSAHTGDAVVIVTESVPRVSGVVEQ